VSDAWRPAEQPSCLSSAYCILGSSRQDTQLETFQESSDSSYPFRVGTVWPEKSSVNMELWRSEEMMLVQLIIPAEAAHDTVAALGDVGLLQFKDLNQEKSAFQRTYANQVKRCDEMARKLRFFESEVHKAELFPRENATLDNIDIDELEAKLEELESELLEVNSNSERLQRSHSELVELQLVLEKAAMFFDEARAEGGTLSETNPLNSSEASGGDIAAPLLEGQGREPGIARLGFVAGVIPQEKISAFERVLFRATRGNMFLKQAAVGSVVDPSSGEKMEKSVFMVFFAGENARAKILKICEAFGASRYPFPEEVSRQQQMHGEVMGRLRELSTTNEAAQRHRENVLQGIASSLKTWSIQVKREKSVYHTLNKLSIDVTRKCLVAEAWCPVMARSRIQDALRLAADQASAQVGTIFQPLPTHEQPPTFYITNKVQEAFQTIVEAYGVARYREANPTVYSIVTFPFQVRRLAMSSVSCGKMPTDTFSFPRSPPAVCHHVWRRRSCYIDDHVCGFHVGEGEADVETGPERNHSNGVWWPLCHPLHGAVLPVLWCHIQRSVLDPNVHIWFLPIHMRLRHGRGDLGVGDGKDWQRHLH